MHFDDRLATVLRHRPSGERAARTQFRQLLDLLGQRGRGRDQKLLATAWLRLGALGEAIPADERATIVREESWRFESPELAAHLAEAEPTVAAAALARAKLSESDWEALIPRLPMRARGFLRLRRDMPAGALVILERLGIGDRALPLPPGEEPLVLDQEAGEAVPEEAAPEAAGSERVVPFPANDAGPKDRKPDALEPAAARESTPISALVERIEAFQRNRHEQRSPESADNDSHPPLPFPDMEQGTTSQDASGLVFTTDAEGRIDWAEDAVAPMLRYFPLREALAGDALRAMQRRLPVGSTRVRLEGAPRIAGDWYVDAAPRFDPLGGQFIGYAGRLRRPSRDPSEDVSDESDRIRQLLHELRTPVNAIQGFAEVIQQQLFGPVPHEYRALAANIAGDAARILAGFEELDRLAKLESGLREVETGASDFSAVVAAHVAQLQDILKPREAGFAPTIEPGHPVGIAQHDAEALSWRILASLAAAAAPGETVALTLDRHDGAIVLECVLPATLQKREDIFSAEGPKAGSSGLLTPGSFGSGFALRLARAEARSSGGELSKVEDRLILTLPLLTAQDADPSRDMTLQSAAGPGTG